MIRSKSKGLPPLVYGVVAIVIVKLSDRAVDHLAGFSFESWYAALGGLKCRGETRTPNKAANRRVYARLIFAVPIQSQRAPRRGVQQRGISIGLPTIGATRPTSRLLLFRNRASFRSICISMSGAFARSSQPHRSGPPFVTPSTPTSSVRSTTVAAGRPPRSRRNRPCDHCRRVKTRCTVDEHGPPCLQCSKTERECTFDAAPPARRPRASISAPYDGIHRGSLSPGPSTRHGRSSISSDSPSRRRRSQSPRFQSSAPAYRTPVAMSRPSAIRPLDTEASLFDGLAPSDEYEAHGK